MLYQNRYYKNEEKFQVYPIAGEDNILGARLLDKILYLFEERAGAHARTHARMYTRYR